MISKKVVYNYIFILLFLLAGPIVFAAAPSLDYNATLIALNQSRRDMQEMLEAGFSIARVNDTLSQAEQLFQAQYALQKSGGAPDYSLILERTKEITNIRKHAEEVSDELKALGSRLKDAKSGSEVHSIFNNAKKEFADERYDKVSALVEEAYSKITEEQAFQTRFIAIYEASTKTIVSFFKKNLKIIMSIGASILIIYLIVHKKLKIFFINKKIDSLNFEKEILQKLIKKSQYEYFHLFKIPEELYHIRITKFGELIRDIDRQVPLLVEEREKVKGAVKEEVKTERFKKFIDRFTVYGLILSILIMSIFFFILYSKIASYTKILEFIKLLGFKLEILGIVKGVIGIIALVITGLLIIISVLILEYKLNKARRLEALGISGPLNIFNYYKILISHIIEKIKLFCISLVQKIEEIKQYRKLLKEKKEQDKYKIRYLRNQRMILFKVKLQELTYPIMHPILFIKLRRAEKGLKTETFTKKVPQQAKPSIKEKLKQINGMAKAFFDKIGLYKLFEKKEEASALEETAEAIEKRKLEEAERQKRIEDKAKLKELSEDKARLKELRRQRYALFKNNLKQKINSMLNALKFAEKERELKEEEKIEKISIFDKIRNKIDGWKAKKETKKAEKEKLEREKELQILAEERGAELEARRKQLEEEKKIRKEQKTQAELQKQRGIDERKRELEKQMLLEQKRKEEERLKQQKGLEEKQKERQRLAEERKAQLEAQKRGAEEKRRAIKEQKVTEKELDNKLKQLDNLILQKFEKLKGEKEEEKRHKEELKKQLEIERKKQLDEKRKQLEEKRREAERKAQHELKKKQLQEERLRKQKEKIIRQKELEAKKREEEIRKLEREKAKKRKKEEFAERKKEELSKLELKQEAKISSNYLTCNGIIFEANKVLEDNNLIIAKKLYNQARDMYILLERKEKTKIYPYLLALYNKLVKKL